VRVLFARLKRAGQRRKVAKTAIRSKPSNPPTTPPTIGPAAGAPALLAGEVLDVFGAVPVDEDEDPDVVI
jgi:hypothetical protein